MSLRARLAVLYTAVVGGILLLFGTTVYIIVSVALTSQGDITLTRAANEIIRTTRIETPETGNVRVIILPALDLAADVYVQVWGRNNELQATSPNISAYKKSLDPAGLLSGKPIFHNVTIENARLRVLSVPLNLSDRWVATLQVGSSLAFVDASLRVLSVVLIIGVLLSMVFASFAGWISTRQALTSLDAVTQTALQITRADDLSRRIPYNGPPKDEVGQLINAFNQTLERLEKLFNTQRRFLADVGHELRTPLTVIKGNVALMRRMENADIESLDSIESEVDRLTRLVGDLLLLAQAESSKLPLVYRLVELDSLLLEVFQQMQVLARGKLSIKLGEFDQMSVCGDPDRLKQVLVNLIGNAIKYTPAGGEVIVSLGKEDKRARITVSDTGPGIPVEDLPYIFERFYRGEKSRTRSRDGKGFGLGLSIAYWIVQNHGGQIEVANRVPNGTTFCVWLPLAEGECKEKEPVT
jgi:signal transduction histidine kinase